MHIRTFFLALLSLSVNYLTAQELPASPGESDGIVIVYLPDHSQAFLDQGDLALPVVSGVAISCAAGDYTLKIDHSDYTAYTRTITVVAGKTSLYVPRLQLSHEYFSGQIVALQKQRDNARSESDAFLTWALVSGGLSLASWAVVGGLEWELVGMKTDLLTTYANYQQASGADAPGLWASVQTKKSQVDLFRTYENCALGAGVILSLTGVGLLGARPSPGQVDGWLEGLTEQEG